MRKGWPVPDRSAPRRPPPELRWRWLGRLLPRSVRERVFEPAFADLYRDTLERRSRASASRVPFAFRALATYAGCTPPALARLFVVRGKPTRLSRALGVLVVVSLGLVVAAQWLGETLGY